MSHATTKLAAQVQDRFGETISVTHTFGEVTVEIAAADILPVCQALSTEADLAFEELIDLCGVDYLTFGQAEWETHSATDTGFSRGVTESDISSSDEQNKDKRFAVVYHLLSISTNRRLRLKVFLHENDLIIDSVTDIWASANWFEREAFDLYGIMFRGHSDLRRILTDYGFIGHPFRKDFPLIGNVEMRYDAEKRRVVYEPVSIEPRTLVPKVVREDLQDAAAGANGE